MEHAVAMQEQLVILIKSDRFKKNFRLLHANPEFTNCCFWFLPDKLVYLYESDFDFVDESKALFGPKRACEKLVAGTKNRKFFCVCLIERKKMSPLL